MGQAVVFVLALAALAALIVALTRLSLLIGTSRRNDQDDWYRVPEKHVAQRDSNQTRTNTLAAAIDTIGAELGAQRRQQNHHENRRRLLEIIGLGAAITAAALAGYSAFIFQWQLDEMRDEQRPWVYATNIGIVGPVTHDQQGLQMTITFTMKNVGRLPALQAMPSFRISLHGFGPSEMDETCKFAESWFTRHTIFPGDIVVQPMGGIIKQAEIDKMTADSKRWGGGVLPAVSACIAYKIPGESRFRHTPYMFTLKMVDDAAAKGCCNVPLDQPSLPPGTVTLMDMPVGKLTEAD